MNTEKLKELYDYHFSTHKATLIQNSDRFFIVDWRREDGSGNHYVNYIVDKLRGSLIISGDLGDCIATWYNPLEPEKIKTFVRNTEYFIGKFQCSSDKYRWHESDVYNDIKEHLENTMDENDFLAFFENNDYYIENEEEFWREIAYEAGCSTMNPFFNPTERLVAILSDIDPEYYEWLYDCGKEVNPRVYLWAEGFRRALEQLENNTTDDELRIRNISADICDLFEELLDAHDIDIPSTDRTGDESEAHIYGTEYSDLEDSVTDILIDLCDKLKNNPDITINTDEY